MTTDEYRELVDFLGRKFDRIDERFEQVDQRFEQVDRRFENVEGEIRGVRVLVEENASNIRKVAEGVQVANDRLERSQGEVREEFAGVRREMKWGFDGIHARVDRLEDAMTTQVRETRRP